MLSQKAKYAIRALLHLARHGQGRPVLIKDIAEKEKLPRKFLEVILLEMKGAGILHSRPGKGGGYTLNRDPATIPLSRVIRLIDGPLALVSCVSQTGYAPCRDCLDERTCSIRAVLKRVRDSTAAILDETSLGDMLNDEKILEQKQLEQRPPHLDYYI
ncbi:MAG: Rrf2 family transcriptional regulator [Verrucomicrobiae bacterium]|nr:Rrf2 family transcriptional regulator [Verrucomicrobiae bacterium]